MRVTIISNIDFDLLRKQKDQLVILGCSGIIKSEFIETLNDIVYLIDEILDQAASQLTEEAVFGPQS